MPIVRLIAEGVGPFDKLDLDLASHSCLGAGWGDAWLPVRGLEARPHSNWRYATDFAACRRWLTRIGTDFRDRQPSIRVQGQMRQQGGLLHE